jgi:DnaJ family protein C protein 3
VFPPIQLTPARAPELTRWQLKKYPKAKPFCETALATNPNSEYGQLSKAKAHLDAEEYDAAINVLTAAHEQHQTPAVTEMLNEAKMLLRRSQQKDYYKVLGVSRDADERDIKRAYRKLTMQFHPDKASVHGIPKEEAQSRMSAINEAYETLSDPELRARVDRGDDPNDPTAQQRGGPFHGSPFGHGGQQFMFKQGGGGFSGEMPFQFNFGGF